jgi:hypothetical protein
MKAFLEKIINSSHYTDVEEFIIDVNSEGEICEEIVDAIDQKLLQAKRAYYTTNNTIMTDCEYDFLEDLLIKMTKCQIKVGYCSEWDSCLHADSKPS